MFCQMKTKNITITSDDISDTDETNKWSTAEEKEKNFKNNLY